MRFMFIFKALFFFLYKTDEKNINPQYSGSGHAILVQSFSFHYSIRFKNNPKSKEAGPSKIKSFQLLFLIASSYEGG